MESLSSQHIATISKVKQSILQISTQAPNDNSKITELIEKFEVSSLSLQKTFLEVNTQISRLKETYFDPIINDSHPYKALDLERK